MMSVPGPSCRLSVQGVNPPVCCVLDGVCKGQFCGFTQCAVSSRGGGPRHIGTGTSLTHYNSHSIKQHKSYSVLDAVSN